jgi:hypothetical protein
MMMVGETLHSLRIDETYSLMVKRLHEVMLIRVTNSFGAIRAKSIC